MRHLGPIRSSNNITNATSHQAHTAASSAPASDSSIGARFASLEAQRNTIRAVLAPTQRSVKEGGNNIGELRRVLSHEVNATAGAKQDEATFYDKSVESSATAIRLEGEAKILKAVARSKPESIARMLIMEAKLKLEEAKREEKKAQEYIVNAEETKREVGSHKRAEGVVSQKLDKAITTSSDNQSTVSDLSVKEASTASSPEASSGSKSTGGSGASTASTQETSSKFQQTGGGAATGGTTGGGGSTGNAVSRSTGASNSGYQGAEYTVTTRTDNGIFTNTTKSNTGNGYVDAAIVLLRAIGFHSSQNARNSGVNPVRQLALHLTNKGLSEQATTYLEAALVDSTLQGSPINQTIIFLKATSATLHGEAETNIAYWKEVLNENKQLSKQTHDLAKMA